MTESKYKLLERVGWFLVFLMALLQGVYAGYAYLQPEAFSILRGTELVAAGDTDWIQIYASRTLFIALVVGYLLYQKNYRILIWVALFGAVMPLTDAYLAYEAQAPSKVVFKHLATLAYLLVTSFILSLVVKNKN